MTPPIQPSVFLLAAMISIVLKSRTGGFPSLVWTPTASTATMTVLDASASARWASRAPNQPVVLSVNKVSEIATVRNVSTAAVDITGWRTCSISGNQLHATLSGSLAPGEVR